MRVRRRAWGRSRRDPARVRRRAETVDDRPRCGLALHAVLPYVRGPRRHAPARRSVPPVPEGPALLRERPQDEREEESDRPRRPRPRGRRPSARRRPGRRRPAPVGTKRRLRAACDGYARARRRPRTRRSPPPCWRPGARSRWSAGPARTSSGIDVAEATRRGVVVVHAPDAGARLRGRARARARAGVRPRPGRRRRRASRAATPRRRTGDGVEVRGKTLGIIGVRPSSALLVERARALGMTVLACEPQAGADGRRRRSSASRRSRSSRRRTCWWCRRRPEAALFGAAELAQLKPGARVVSPCSPGAVDLDALAAALAAGTVAGAAVAVERGRGAVSRRPRRAAPAAHERGRRVDRRRAPPRRRVRGRAGRRRPRGRLLRGAVNVPAAAGDDADELMPYMDLCSRLGRLLVQLAGAPVDAVEITYGGSVAYFDTRLLTLGVLGGVLADRAGAPVNFVNAEVVAARARRHRLRDARSRASPTSRGSSPSPSPGRAARCPCPARRWAPSTSRAWCACSARTSTSSPRRTWPFLRYVDAPGIGGKVGTLLGRVGSQHRPHVGRARQARRRGRDGAHARRVAHRRADGEHWSTAAASSTRGRSSCSQLACGGRSASRSDAGIRRLGAPAGSARRLVRRAVRRPCA